MAEMFFSLMAPWTVFEDPLVFYKSTPEWTAEKLAAVPRNRGSRKQTCCLCEG